MVELRLLGAVLALVDDAVVDLGPARQRCVLAALAVDANQVVSVDRLIQRVWGEHPPLRARQTLVNYVSRLRQVLTASTATIVRRSGGYSLAVLPSEIDLHRFHDLRSHVHTEDDRRAAVLLEEALGLWRGEALTGLAGEWAEAERARLHQERLDAESDLTDVVLRLGHGEGLVAGLSARVTEYPLDERIGGQYLLALHRAGRTADALEHYRRLRERLVEELGTDPSPVLQDLHRRLLTADPALSTATAEADRPSVVPLQLPAALGQFIGRVTELAELDRVLATPDSPSPGNGRSAVAISSITGTGGIGKTWLALTWAHRNLHRFPDGQLFADLRGFGPGDPKQAPDVLADFLAALGVDRDHQPQDADARAALYRTHTTGKRLLILLDNAATTDQVVPLLPGGGSCTVLVTSRNRLSALLTRHGAHPVHVDVLTDSEARTLLKAALGHATATAAQRAVTELIELCDGFPLALGLIAARVHTHPDLLHDVATELRDLGLEALRSDDPNASLPAVLSWSLRHLTDLQRRVFGLLGVAPGPDIDLPAATSLTGLPARDTRAALHALVNASLVTHAPGERYSMHDLIRDYAATTAHDDLPEPVVRAALERVVDCYLHTAYTADRLLDPHRDPLRPAPSSPGARPQPLTDRPTALAWLDAHHPHVLAAQRTAAAHHRHQNVWQFAWALTTFHWWRGHHHDDQAVWQVVAGIADHLPDLADRIVTHRHLGQAGAELGQHEQAIGFLHRALTLAEHHHDATQQALTHHALTRAWELNGDDRQALEHARRALDLFRDLGQPTRAADALNTVGWFVACLGDHDTARSHCQAALTMHRHHRNLDGEAATLDSLGWIDHRTGHHDLAIHHYRQALVLRHTLGNTTWAADTLDRLGHPYVALGQHAEARVAWREALELYREQGRGADAERVQRQLDALDTPNRDRPAPGCAG